MQTKPLLGGGGSGGTGVSSGRRPGLDAEKPLDGHSVIGGSLNNNQLKTLQGELSEVILTFSSINDTLKGLEHTVQKHGSVITDLGEHSSETQPLCITALLLASIHSLVH